MSNDPFATGSGGGSGASVSDLEGKLLLIYGKEYLTDVKTADFGVKDAVDAEVHVIEDGEVVDVRFFQGRLIGSLKRHVGKRPYLGRLGKSAEKVKGNRAWEFSDPTDKDKKLAREYIANLPKEETDDPFAS